MAAGNTAYQEVDPDLAANRQGFLGPDQNPVQSATMRLVGIVAALAVFTFAAMSMGGAFAMPMIGFSLLVAGVAVAGFLSQRQKDIAAGNRCFSADGPALHSQDTTTINQTIRTDYYLTVGGQRFQVPLTLWNRVPEGEMVRVYYAADGSLLNIDALAQPQAAAPPYGA